ncbi:DUF1385 domain-containing protein [Bacteriovoracaceae bacterium]|nr:DUF1385 domain-containing protein [Bacteriovoracaceae bacterium]
MMLKRVLKNSILFLLKQYTSIGGQAVIEGVMMRSPNAFVVALRQADGSIRLRRDQWYGFTKKLKIFKMPFFRGVLTLVETMLNGIVSLNYSANVAMKDELLEKAMKQGKTEEEAMKKIKEKEKVSWETYLTIGVSFLFGMGLFVFLPHAITYLINHVFELSWDLESFSFHFVDGMIKALIFILYIFIIGFLPDVKRVFQYHGAEHKSIATFEAGEELIVENAKKFSTLHPRCGTTFVFFLLFISIVLFSGLFVIIPVGVGLPPILKHAVAIVYKIFFMFPIAGISYELIKFAGRKQGSMISKIISFPGMMLQKLTTNEPEAEQLEVALASIKAVLFLEEKYNLKEANEKILNLEEVDIKDIQEMESTNSTLKDFLEA